MDPALDAEPGAQRRAVSLQGRAAIEIGGVPPVVRARTSGRLPVVLSRDEVTALLKPLAGTMQLVVTLPYGAGLRLEECLTLRVKDLDFDRHPIIVRQGKGRKDRMTMLPAAAREVLTVHLADVRRIHEADPARGFGRVVLPFALDRRFPRAATDDHEVSPRAGAWCAGRGESSGPAVSAYARGSRVTGEAPRVRPDLKCRLMNRFPPSCPHRSGRYAPALARNDADPPFGRRFRPWPSRVTTPGGPVGFRLQSPSTLEITTANADARSPRVTRGLVVY